LPLFDLLPSEAVANFRLQIHSLRLSHCNCRTKSRTQVKWIPKVREIQPRATRSRILTEHLETEQPSVVTGGPPMYSPGGQPHTVPMQQMSPQQGMPPQVMYQMAPQVTGHPQPQMVYAGHQPPMGQPHPGGQPMQSPGQGMVPAGTMPTQYQTAMPIPALSVSNAPVDCPSCGQRAMTTTAMVSGGTTQ
jgi:hypothetical protein